MADKEIKEAKSLRWLANQFPKVENPKDNGDRLCNCINLYCTNAAELIERQAAEIKRLSTLAELGNTRASDYRVMRDRALKAEAGVERLKKQNEILLNNAANAFQEGLNENQELFENTILDSFAERLKKRFAYNEIIRNTIDNVLNSMKGKNNNEPSSM